MSKLIALTTHRPQDTSYSKKYDHLETEALKAAGFEIVSFKDVDHEQLKDADVLVRCYAAEEAQLEQFVIKQGGRPIVRNMDSANDWYRHITWGTSWYGREISHASLQRFRYLDEPYEVKELRNFIGDVFNYFGRDVDGERKVFFKADVKGTLPAGVRNEAEALEEITYWLALSCHNRLSTLIFANPISIRKKDTYKYRVEEYRCFIVDDGVSSISLYTDRKSQRTYGKVQQYAHMFANRFRNFLPVAYVLDIARLESGELVVVELNGFGASGFFADHDLTKVFKDIAAITQ